MATAHIALRTHVGLERASNQDTVGVGNFMTIGSSASLAIEFDIGEPVMVVVADGMGGHLGGEVASRLAVGSLLERQGSISDTAGLRDALVELNTIVFRESLLLPERSAMGTTMNGLWITPSELCAFNVGDSATFEMIDGYLVKRSVDDVRRDGGALTQCLGGTRSRVSIEPHLHVAETTDSRWLLCSDGLSSYVPRATVQSLLSERVRTPSEVADTLLTAALDAGAPDNVSIVVVQISETT